MYIQDDIGDGELRVYVVLALFSGLHYLLRHFGFGNVPRFETMRSDGWVLVVFGSMNKSGWNWRWVLEIRSIYSLPAVIYINLIVCFIAAVCYKSSICKSMSNF